MNRDLICAFVIIAAVADRAGFAAEPDIDIQFVASASPELRAVAGRWVERAKSAVAAYYGEFPVERLRINITPRAVRRPRGGGPRSPRARAGVHAVARRTAGAGR